MPVKTAIVPYTRVRATVVPGFLNKEVYATYLKELRGFPWEQSFNGMRNGIRRPLGHLEYCVSFAKEVEAYVTNYNEGNAGQDCVHTGHPLSDKWPSFLALKSCVDRFIGVNNVEVLLYRPASTESNNGKGEGISPHIDADQLTANSPIGGFVAGVGSDLTLFARGCKYSLETPANSLYILENLGLEDMSQEEREEARAWWSERDLPTTRNLVHSRNGKSLQPSEFQAVAVFRMLSPWRFTPQLRERCEVERGAPLSLEWDRLDKSVWRYPFLIGTVLKKPLNLFHWYLLEEVNQMENLVYRSNHSDFFGPGDEFNSNPLATALLGIHSCYNRGLSYSGNKKDGIASIRCGVEDEVSDSTVIFRLRSDCKSVEAFNVTRRSQKMVRVLLSSKVHHPGRMYEKSQYYLGNMYLHQVVRTYSGWDCTFRTFARNLPCVGDKCPCCNKTMKQSTPV